MLTQKQINEYLSAFHPRNWRLFIVGLLFVGFAFFTMLPLFHGFFALFGVKDSFSPKLAAVPMLEFASHLSALVFAVYFVIFKYASRTYTRTRGFLLLGAVLAFICSSIGISIQML